MPIKLDASKTNLKKSDHVNQASTVQRHVIGKIIPFNRFSIWNQRDSFRNRLTNVFYFQTSYRIEMHLMLEKFVSDET